MEEVSLEAAFLEERGTFRSEKHERAKGMVGREAYWEE